MAPLILIGPVMLLLAGVVALASHGPLGWVAAALLVVAVAWTTRALLRAVRVWWASTKAPERWH